jgi:hypothetical protein
MPGGSSTVDVATGLWLGAAERWAGDAPVVVLPRCIVLATNPAAAQPTMIGKET